MPDLLQGKQKAQRRLTHVSVYVRCQGPVWQAQETAGRLYQNVEVHKLRAHASLCRWPHHKFNTMPTRWREHNTQSLSQWMKDASMRMLSQKDTERQGWHLVIHPVAQRTRQRRAQVHRGVTPAHRPSCEGLSHWELAPAESRLHRC